MKLFIQMKIIFLFLLFSSVVQSQHEEYIGLWQTLDDETNKPRSVVDIYLDNGKLVGKIVKFFPEPGEDANPLCDKCKDDLHNKKVIGMKIISDMKFSKSEWKKGQILDPENGKFYDCKIWLENNKLKVRGYIGFFFRTQEWIKYVSSDSAH